MYKAFAVVFMVSILTSFSYAQSVRTVTKEEIEAKNKKETTTESKPTDQVTPPSNTNPAPNYTPPPPTLKTSRTYQKPISWISAYATFSGWSRPLLSGKEWSAELTVLKDWDYAGSGDAFGGGVLYSPGSYEGEDTSRNKYSGTSTSLGGFLQWVSYWDNPSFSALSFKFGGKQVTHESSFSMSRGTYKQKQITLVGFASFYVDLLSTEDDFFSTVSAWIGYEMPIGQPSLTSTFTDSLGVATNIKSEAFDLESASLGVKVVAFSLPIGRKGNFKLNGLGQAILQKVSDVKRVLFSVSPGLSLYYNKLPLITAMVGVLSRPNEHESWQSMYTTYSLTLDLGHLYTAVRSKSVKKKK